MIRSDAEKFIGVLLISCVAIGIGAWFGYELPRHIWTFIAGMYVGAHIAWALSARGQSR